MKNKQEEAKPKIGAGHAQAMLRQGLKELRQALYPESNVAAPPEYGLYGTRTPGEVAEAREPKELDSNEEPHSILQERLDQAKGHDGREPEPPQQERD